MYFDHHGPYVFLRHALEDMPPEDIEIPPEAPPVHTRDNRRRLVLAPDMPPAECEGKDQGHGHHGGSKVEDKTVIRMDPLQYVTYSGGLGEC